MASINGYNLKFLGPSLAFPKLDKKVLAPLLQGGGTGAKYTHFSVFVHKERRLPLITAVNIKGEAYNALGREGSEPWKLSPYVDEKFQIDNRFYGADENTFDRGHLVRRVDPCWGDRETADAAEADTFTWSNCTPQHRKLNREGGVWYQLEQHVMEHGVKNKIGNISVFAGPVLDAKDPLFKKQYLGTDIPIPLVYWKVIVWKKSDGKLYAVGFIMSQWEWIKNKVKPIAAPAEAKVKLKDDYFENLKFKDHKTYQVPIYMIEKATGIKFSWTGVDFVYKGNQAKTVKAWPLKKVFAFADVKNTFAQVAGMRKGLATPHAVRKELNKKTPLPKKVVEEKIRNGEAYRLKRYELKNITL